MAAARETAIVRAEGAKAPSPICTLGRNPGLLNPPLSASATELFGPRGVCVLADGSVWVADTGHHRVLGWSANSISEQAPAQWRLGQANWQAEARNGGAEANASSFSTPVGLCAYGLGLAVADSWNHRVLIWTRPPKDIYQPADFVLGQLDFHAALGNRGDDQAAADSLFWPSGVYCDGQRLLVADTGNRRVLIWHQLPTHNGQAADLVLGQPNMQSRDQNGGCDLDAHGMVFPHALALWGEKLVVADAGANRIMLWDAMPKVNGAPCTALLGQTDTHARLHNRGHAQPTSSSLAMPYALTVVGDELWVADTANSRLLAWRAGESEAHRVHGQIDYGHGGDNRWQVAAPDSLCWPYGLAIHQGRVYIADTGNNRVQIWDAGDLGVHVPALSTSNA